MRRCAGSAPRLKRVRVADHNLAQGYQAGGGAIGPNTSSGLFRAAVRVRRASDSAAGAATAFTQPPGLGYRVPDAAPPLQPAAAFPSVPAAPPPAASSSGGWFSLKPYAVYFDVDTADVLHRMRLACVPFGSSFMTTVKDKPDLCVASPRFACADAHAARAHARYGPFWIAATLVFIAAATGNLSSYLAYVKLASTTPDAVWSYDIKKVSLSAVLFYGYISFLPLSVRMQAVQMFSSADKPAPRSCTLRCGTGPPQPASSRWSHCTATRS